MARDEKMLLAFNRGIVSQLGLSRLDVERLAMSAEMQTNWMPRVLGSMMLRPGTEYLGSSRNENSARHFPFVFSTDDTALLEFTNNRLRVWVDDQIVTHETVSTTITNGNMSAGGSWTDVDDSGATSSFSGGLLRLVGDGASAYARRRQTLTISGPDQGVEHSLYVDVNQGDVYLRIGTSAGGEQVMEEIVLTEGFHHLRFTPNVGTIYLDLAGKTQYESQVDECQIESGGNLEIVTIYGSDELDDIRVSQSGDVVFVANAGDQQHRIERRGEKAWAIVKYWSDDGPFRIENVDPITIEPDVLVGDVTLTASDNIFKSTNVGSLFRVSSVGQLVQRDITAEDQWTDPIRVTGTGAQRNILVTLTGTWTATVKLQYSVGAPGSWVDSGTQWTGFVNGNYFDGRNNEELYYRIGVKSGEFTSGTVEAQLTYASGSIDGIVRITSFTSETSVDGIVLKTLGGTNPSATWAEGAWSDRRGWPTAVALYESRLCWVGSDNIWMSITDEYHSFDDTVEGDSGTIARRVGEGPIDNIHWLMSAGRLLMGTASNSKNIPPAVISNNNVSSIRSSSFGEPLTPNNFNIKDDAARGVFVDRTGQRLYELSTTSKQYSNGLNDYSADDLSLFTPDLNEIGIDRIAVQMKPDVRVHCVRSDGTVGVLVFDRAENVICWVEVETDGEVEDVAVLPGTVEDQVYYHVKRTIGGTKRYLEKWAMENECIGGSLNKQADSFFEYSGGATTTITGLNHLDGEQVVVWGNGKDLGTYTVSSNQITGLSESVTSAIVGLGYTAQFKGAKLASLQANSAGLNVRRAIRQLGLTMWKSHAQGLQYGPDFNNLYDLPGVERGQITADDAIWDTYDEDFFAFGGEWDTDARICLQAQAPKPCTILSAVARIEI